MWMKGVKNISLPHRKAIDLCISCTLFMQPLSSVQMGTVYLLWGKYWSQGCTGQIHVREYSYLQSLACQLFGQRKQKNNILTKYIYVMSNTFKKHVIIFQERKQAEGSLIVRSGNRCDHREQWDPEREIRLMCKWKENEKLKISLDEHCVWNFWISHMRCCKVVSLLQSVLRDRADRTKGQLISHRYTAVPTFTWLWSSRVRSMEISYRSSPFCSLSCYDNSFSALHQTCLFWYKHRSDTGLAAQQTEPHLGTCLRFLFAACVPGGGKSWICLKNSLCSELAFGLGERRENKARKHDGGHAGSSSSFGGTEVVCVRVTAEVAWSTDCSRWGSGSSCAVGALSIWNIAFCLLCPLRNHWLCWCLLKDEPSACFQLQKPDVPYYIPSTLLPHI